MREKDYIKIVEWSNEDGCYIGSAPPLVGHCCHGDTEGEVYRQLAEIVPDVIETYKKEGFRLPAPTGKNYSGKFIVRVNRDLHKAAALRAMLEHHSLNSFVESALETRLLMTMPKAKRRKKVATLVSHK